MEKRNNVLLTFKISLKQSGVGTKIKTLTGDQSELQSSGLLQLLGCVVSRWSANITSYKRASAYQSDVHQGCAPVGQRGAIIPGSAPMVLVLPPYPLHPSLYTSLPSMLLFSSSPPQAGGVWTTQRDLAARGGIQGGAPGPQVRPELNLPPSTSPGCQLHQPSSSLCPAGQSSRIYVPCNLGTRGMEGGREGGG